MCNLRIYANKPEGNLVNVTWQIGKQPFRSLAVDVQVYLSDIRTAAELAALHHLLLVRAVAGENRGTANLQITCSRSATKKLLRGKSSKLDLIPFSAGMRARFPELSLCVNPRAELQSIKPEETITLKAPLEYIQDTRIAKVAIRHHAIERFMQRAHCDNIDQARKAIVKMLASERLKKADISSAQKRRSVIKHKKDSELWVCDQWYFRIVNEHKQKKSLVTIYQKELH